MTHPTLQWKRRVFLGGMALMVLGVGLTVYFGAGVANGYREMHFAHMHHFNNGNPDTSAVRPWMSIAYVSAAYHIPEDVLFEQLGVPKTPENRLASFRMLNDQLHYGSSANIAVFLDTVRAVIDRFKQPPGAPHPPHHE